MEVTFFGQCGFLVDLGQQVLLFDYCPRFFREKTWALLLDRLQGRSPTVFVSHVHGDHFTEDVFTLPARQFILGQGVPALQDAVTLLAGQVADFDDLQVTAFPSTDEGAAFLVRAGGCTIYHAGDLGWWHWQGEPEAVNADMAAAFQRYTAPLLHQQIDLAFLHADPRQRDAWLWGLDYLMRQGHIACAIPMHFWNQKGAPGRVLEDPVTAPYRQRLLPLSAVGDQAPIPLYVGA